MTLKQVTFQTFSYSDRCPYWLRTKSQTSRQTFPNFGPDDNEVSWWYRRQRQRGSRSHHRRQNVSALSSRLLTSQQVQSTARWRRQSVHAHGMQALVDHHCHLILYIVYDVLTNWKPLSQWSKQDRSDVTNVIKLTELNTLSLIFRIKLLGLYCAIRAPCKWFVNIYHY